jgi:hypothetical protein
MTTAVAALLLALAPALADGPKIGPHGGQIRDAGGKHLELVISKGKLALYVTDSRHKPVSTQGMKARAIILSGKKRANVKLTPDSKNVLWGGGDFPKTKNMKTVVLLTLPDGKTIQARFSK